MSKIWDYFFAMPEVELYLFSCGARYYPYIATSESSYTYGGRVYHPETITRSSLHFSSDYARDVLTVTLPATNEVAGLFFSGTPEHLMRLYVYRGQKGQTLTNIWSGLVNGATYSYGGDAYSCELSCETAASRMERLGLARCYQLSCPHVLFSSKCGVNANSYASGRTVTAVSGATVTVSGWADNGYYAGGKFQTVDGGELRYINGNTGNVLYLDRALSVPVGKAVTIWPGCNKARSTCVGKFGNGSAFGGFPWLPVQNPYISTIG